MKHQLIKADWIDSDGKEKLIQSIIGSDSCLNVCCGYSGIGTERMDISGQSWRTNEGDLFNLEYAESSFDWVYCDPPFEYYTSGKNRFRWQRDLFRISKKGLITQRPKVQVRLNSKSHQYYIIEDGRLALTLLRIDYH